MPADAGKAIHYGIMPIQARGDSSQLIQACQRELGPSAQRMGVNLTNNPSIVPHCMMADIDNKLAVLQKQNCRFVVLILFDKFCYFQVKRYSDILSGLPTQCVLDKTLRRGQCGPNLMLKINGKLGGVNWSIPSMVSDKELIQVFGIDVTHPAPGGRREMQMSIAAVTASISADLMRYAVVVRQQNTRQTGNNSTREIVDAMDSIVYDLVQACAKNNGGKLPDRLIFYRDGVSEGQFQHVLVEELTAIQKVCRNLRPDYEPAITYITVGKRHHIRFLPLQGERNVKPGTVVDTQITAKNEFDFYLCSHEGIQGTSKPAHYSILYDDSNWGSAQLQLFTYCLCHAYLRCPRSVSIPAPTYYAHLAAFRARDWLNGVRSVDMLIEKNQFKIHNLQKSAMFFL
ncbi:Protein argonaute-2 [Cichlidogyrus casuarinus]|uniref:Protein argonaute-2 n=1 Tax=Cichlidogyrus casuarinus TaxID=1844966 RepID=A0ABD2PY95_9PLAT